MVTLLWDRVDFRVKSIMMDKYYHFIMIDRPILQEA